MNRFVAGAMATGLYRYLRSLGPAVHKYGNASHAFKDALLHLKRSGAPGIPNVVMPSFIPAKLVRTILAAGYEAKFYDILEGCRFDPQQVEDLVDNRTTSIFGVHYFGHPADMKTLLEIARRHGVALIEDCAHVLRGSSDGKSLGTYGDYALFSARKMLQISDGGFLLLNLPTDGFIPTYDGRVRSTYTSTRYLLSRAKHLYLRATGGRDPLRLVRPSRIGSIDPLRSPALKVLKMSFATSVYANLIDIDRNSSLRKENYRRLAEALRTFHFLRPVYSCLPDQWTPYSLPMMVDENGRPALQSELLRRGVSCGLGWPESPFNHHAPGTKKLASRLIEFPVHPLVGEHQFERTIDACESYGKKNGKP